MTLTRTLTFINSVPNFKIAIKYTMKYHFYLAGCCINLFFFDQPEIIRKFIVSSVRHNTGSFWYRRDSHLQLFSSTRRIESSVLWVPPSGQHDNLGDRPGALWRLTNHWWIFPIEHWKRFPSTLDYCNLFSLNWLQIIVRFIMHSSVRCSNLAKLLFNVNSSIIFSTFTLAFNI